MFELMTAARFDVDDGTALAVAQIGADHPMFADHFPGHPTLPASIAIELAAQLAGPLAEKTSAARHAAPRWAVLGMVRNAKLVRPVRLPARLHLSARIARIDRGSATARASARIDDDRVLTAELAFGLVAAGDEHADAIRERNERVARWIEAWPRETA